MLSLNEPLNLALEIAIVLPVTINCSDRSVFR